MGSQYTTYKEGLKILKLQNLDDRRENLCLGFAKKCLTNDKVKNLFPLERSKHTMKKRKTNKFKIFKTNTKRFEQSAVPYMRRLLNKDWNNKQESLKV